MTSSGSAYARFQRALATGNLILVRTAAAELPRIAVAEAAAVLLVILRAEPDDYERAAVRRVGRLALERTDVDPDGLSQAAAALEALAVSPESARPMLAEVCRRGRPGAGGGSVHAVAEPAGGYAASPEGGEFTHAAQTAEGAQLDLAHPLGRDPEMAPDLAQRRGVVASDAVAHLHDLALAVGQLAERRLQRLGPQRDVHLVLGRRAVGAQDLNQRQR